MLLNVSTATISVPLALLALIASGCSSSTGQRGDGAGEPGGPIEYQGATYTLASGRLPAGAAFSLTGQRYRYWGHEYIELTASYPERRRVQGGGRSSSGGEMLEWNMVQGCDVRPFVLLDGVVRPRSGAVYVRSGRTLKSLREVALPAGLRTDGALVYGFAPPTRFDLVVRSAVGKTVTEAERLAIRSRPGPCDRGLGRGSESSTSFGAPLGR